MELDPLLPSRLQFALTIGFHFLFPPLTVVILPGLGERCLSTSLYPE